MFQAGEEKARGSSSTFYPQKSLHEIWRVTFHKGVQSDRTRGNGFKQTKIRFRLDFGKKSSSEKVVRPWHRLLRAAAPSLEVFKALTGLEATSSSRTCLCL